MQYYTAKVLQPFSTTWVNLTNNVERKKPISKEVILCGAINSMYKDRLNESLEREVWIVVALGGRDD